MKLTPDDPKLTAYALGELPAAERAAVEAELKQSPEGRRAVEEIRAMGTVLEQELAAEACPALSREQTARVLSAMPKGNGLLAWLFAFDFTPGARWKFEFALASYAVVVTLALVVVSLPHWHSRRETTALPSPPTNVTGEIVQAPSAPENTIPPTLPPPVVVEKSPQPELVVQPSTPKLIQRPAPQAAPPLPPQEGIAGSQGVHLSNVNLKIEPASPTPVVAAQGTAPSPPLPLVAIAFKLPMPSFKGTPDDLPKGEHIEEFSDKPRAAFLAPVGVQNVALNKKVTSSDRSPITGSVSQVTDGNKEAIDDAVVELHKNVQWVQVDLEKEFDVYAILLWHDHRYVQVFRCVVVQAADDPDFTQNVRTFFNNDYENVAGLGIGGDKQYFETNQGKLIATKGAKARYLRFYSKGSNASALNCYTEIEVWGLSAQ